jgi:hypothetical protein
MKQNGQGLVSAQLDRVIGLAVMLLIFELSIHLLFSLMDSVSVGPPQHRGRFYLAPFLFFVSVLLLGFLINLLSGLMEAMKDFRRSFFRH